MSASKEDKIEMLKLVVPTLGAYAMSEDSPEEARGLMISVLASIAITLPIQDFEWITGEPDRPEAISSKVDLSMRELLKLLWETAMKDIAESRDGAVVKEVHRQRTGRQSSN